MKKVAEQTGQVFELPMRDGNPIPRALCQFESVVFELPMRDGNLLSENLPITNEDRFWTSYEGWKREYVLCIFLPTGNGFWTSYEGWKQASLCALHSPSRVFELPMRDGNAAHQIHQIRPILVFELPMRDGNVLRKRVRDIIPPSFWTSYEGWKRLRREESLKRRRSFWTSYEGWKLVNILKRIAPLSCFWTSYEGWKLDMTLSEICLCLAFLNFLWGMET